MRRLNLAILISGRGSNMDSLLKATTASDYPSTPQLVLSNRTDAAGLDRAEAFGVATSVVRHQDYDAREAFEAAMHDRLTRHKIDIIALAGFMRVLTPWFVQKWAGRLVNIHPSLLPRYPGLNTHARALEAGDSEAGCSVHWVSEGVDEGDVIAQTRVPVKTGDTPEQLADRVLRAEHELYPGALAQACRQIIAR
jgi:formyltetrahydrofolate-dependent phosphoribosylglycinamide formyltransferase